MFFSVCASSFPGDSYDLISLSYTGMNLSSTYGISVFYDSLTITLYGQALQSQYVSVLSEIFYQTTADEPGATSRNVEFLISDGEFNATAITKVDIIPVNDPAFFSFQTRNVTFDESIQNNKLQLFESGDTLTDSDGNMLEWISLEIVSPIDVYDALMVDVSTTGLTLDYHTASENEILMLNISGRADNATYLSVLQTVAFSNVFPGIVLTSRLVEVVTYDGETESPPHTITINIQPFDDLPMCFFEEWVRMQYNTVVA